jgi:hypothetical protein
LTNHSITRLAGLLLCLLLLGCQDADTRIPIESMTVYSLDGTYEARDNKTPTGEMFHDYPVLGKTDIADPRDRTAILVAVKKGIAQSDGTQAACFWPRHGVRLVQSGETIEYVICFECLQLNEYRDGDTKHEPTTRSPAAVLDEHLKSAGVPQKKKQRE